MGNDARSPVAACMGEGGAATPDTQPPLSGLDLLPPDLFSPTPSPVAPSPAGASPQPSPPPQQGPSCPMCNHRCSIEGDTLPRHLRNCHTGPNGKPLYGTGTVSRFSHLFHFVHIVTLLSPLVHSRVTSTSVLGMCLAVLG